MTSARFREAGVSYLKTSFFAATGSQFIEMAFRNVFPLFRFVFLLLFAKSRVKVLGNFLALY